MLFRSLTRYPWPGNIRELENLIERIIVTTTSGSAITRGGVLAALNASGQTSGAAPATGTLKQRVSAYEQEIIVQTVEREGSIRRAAQVLGVDHSTLVKKLRRGEQAAQNGE